MHAYTMCTHTHTHQYSDSHTETGPTLTDWISLATSTFVLPLTDWPLTPTISSPAARLPSLAAGVLSKTCTTYRQGQRGAPPPMLMPIRFCESFFRVMCPELTVIPLQVASRIRMSQQISRLIFKFLKTTRTTTQSGLSVYWAFWPAIYYNWKDIFHLQLQAILKTVK